MVPSHLMAAQAQSPPSTGASANHVLFDVDCDGYYRQQNHQQQQQQQCSNSIEENMALCRAGQQQRLQQQQQQQQRPRGTVPSHPAEQVDRACRLLFPLGFLFCNGFYWLYYLKIRDDTPEGF